MVQEEEEEDAHEDKVRGLSPLSVCMRARACMWSRTKQPWHVVWRRRDQCTVHDVMTSLVVSAKGSIR